MNEMTKQLNSEQQTESDIQITFNDTGWTDEERKAMRERGYDDMDIVRAWLD